MDPEMPWLERSTNFPAEASCMLIVHVTRREEHWCHLRNAKLIGVPQINSRWSTLPLHWIHSHLSFHIIYNKWVDILYNNPEIALDTHLKYTGTSISVKQHNERSGHTISSGDESWFPVFDWRGKPSFHKQLKRSFPLGICMWKGTCVLCFKRNGPRDALIRRSPDFPGEASCMLTVHITNWKYVWDRCRDPTESPRPPLHLKKGPNIPLTTWKPRRVHWFKFWRCLTVF